MLAEKGRTVSPRCLVGRGIVDHAFLCTDRVEMCRFAGD